MLSCKAIHYLRGAKTAILLILRQEKYGIKFGWGNALFIKKRLSNAFFGIPFFDTCMYLFPLTKKYDNDISTIVPFPFFRFLTNIQR
jgi:hypothetical protein